MATLAIGIQSVLPLLAKSGRYPNLTSMASRVFKLARLSSTMRIESGNRSLVSRVSPLPLVGSSRESLVVSSGIENLNSDPCPNTDSTSISPSMSSTRFLQMAKPSPLSESAGNRSVDLREWFEEPMHFLGRNANTCISYRYAQPSLAIRYPGC